MVVNGVGRTLLSDAFDFDFLMARRRVRRARCQTKTNIKGVGQECSTQTGYHSLKTIVEKYSNQRFAFGSIFGVDFEDVFFR